MEVALNDPVTFNLNPDSGYAVDTIIINGSSYINNGVSEPPEDSSWVTLYIPEVTEGLSISVSFSACSDDSGVPDKYKHTVTATAGPGGSVSPETQKVVDGEDAVVEIDPEDGMAVDTISTGEDEYVNDGKSD